MSMQAGDQKCLLQLTEMVIVMQDQEYFDRMGEITDDENDMLDLAYGLTETWVTMQLSPLNHVIPAVLLLCQNFNALSADA